VLYGAACIYAAVSASRTDPAEAEQLKADAVDFLRRANAARFFRQPIKLDDLKRNADLGPLRQREEFQKLLRDLAGRQWTKSS
jgi:hypothetical protein